MKKAILGILAAFTFTTGAQARECLSSEALYEAIADTVVTVELRVDGEPIGHGTGTVYTEGRFIVTSDHVVAEDYITMPGVEIYAVTSKGASYKYEVKNRVSVDGTALLVPATVAHPEDYLELEVGEAKVGETIYALGYPMAYGPVFSHGVISKVGGVDKRFVKRVKSMGLKIDEDTFLNSLILTDMPSNPGVSGASVVNCYKDTIGYVLGAFPAINPITLLNSASSEIKTLTGLSYNKHR